MRRKAETDAKIAAWNKKNIHIVQADMMNYDSLKVNSPFFRRMIYADNLLERAPWKQHLKLPAEVSTTSS